MNLNSYLVTRTTLKVREKLDRILSIYCVICKIAMNSLNVGYQDQAKEDIIRYKYNCVK